MKVQIGITTRCNSKCRFCIRTEQKIYKRPFVDLPFDVYKRIFSPDLEEVQFCGNKGDAIFHPEFKDIIDYTMTKNVHIKINTNGSNFGKKWWHDLGKNINGDVMFSIDGLKDTHSIYRKTNFERVFNNMVSFIEGGGDARWQFIIFEHNEHQLEEAKKLSKEIGCSMFVTVMSRKYDEVIRKPNITIANADDLEPNRCWRENEKFYISSRGQVYPCCYVCCHIQDWCTHPSFFYLRGLKSYEHNIKYFPLSEIIKSDWFAYTYDSIDMCRMHCEV